MKDTFDIRKLVSLLFIAGIALVFTLQFGPGSNGCAAPLTRIESSSAAVVNGKEITTQEFAESYARYMNMMRSQGQPIPDALARQFGLPKQVLNQLVDTELLAQAAKERGITPSDEELARIIHRNPDFQKDGKFDAATYRQVLRDFYRRTPAQYEGELRQQMSDVRLYGLLGEVESRADLAVHEPVGDQLLDCRNDAFDRLHRTDVVVRRQHIERFHVFTEEVGLVLGQGFPVHTCGVRPFQQRIINISDVLHVPDFPAGIAPVAVQ